MIAAPVLTVLLNGLFLALSVLERWQAARHSGGNAGQRWFVLAGAVAVLILTVAYIIIRQRDAARQKRSATSAFLRLSEKRGLSDREQQILMTITVKAQLKRNESIFNLPNVFDKSANELIQEALVQWGAQPSRQMRIELSLLREKLGFRKKAMASVGSPSKGAKPSTRQIPVGKMIQLTRLKGPSPGTMDCEVVENTDMELTVTLDIAMEGTRGAPWRGRYYFGSSIWEFDTFEVSCEDGVLVLNHTDTVRFINRRLFPRTQAQKQAFIAPFPFSKTAALHNRADTDDEPDERKRAVHNAILAELWKPPQFVDAVVVELAGPGLRIETASKLDVSVADKALIIVNLSGTNSEHEINIIEDICEVKHIEHTDSRSSIAVELIGLSDSNVDELIRATNVLAKRSGKSVCTPQSGDYGEQAEVQDKVAQEV